MPITIYTNDDIRPGAIAGQRIAIIGYGSQGRAHAQNLKDSGHDVIVGVREGGKGWKHATADGVPTAEPADAVKGADIIAILTPDMIQGEVYRETIEPNAKPGAAILFAHGFSIIYDRVTPREDMDVILVAPKGPGDLVRREYARGRGVPSLFAIERDATGKARDRAMGYAKGIGGATGGLLETSFREETETDLFGEQAVLCGGAKELVMSGVRMAMMSAPLTASAGSAVGTPSAVACFQPLPPSRTPTITSWPESFRFCA